MEMASFDLLETGHMLYVTFFWIDMVCSIIFFEFLAENPSFKCLRIDYDLQIQEENQILSTSPKFKLNQGIFPMNFDPQA